MVTLATEGLYKEANTTPSDGGVDDVPREMHIETGDAPRATRRLHATSPRTDLDTTKSGNAALPRTAAGQ